MKEIYTSALVILATLVLVVISISWLVGGSLLEPMPHDIGRPPLDMEATNITFASGSGNLIHGWLSHGTAGQGAVLLLHGMRTDRRAMLPRAEFLRRSGYSVLLIDFQAHGETRGGRFTFGDLESRDVVAAIQYLHYKLPDERVGVVGVALGAAAFVLAADRPAVNAVVLETMYPTFQQAVADRLRLNIGWGGPIFAPVVAAVTRQRLDAESGRLRPVDHVANIGVPVLFADGMRGEHPGSSESFEMYSEAAQPKQLWEVPNAAHVDLYRVARSSYEKTVGDFLARYLRNTDPVQAH